MTEQESFNKAQNKLVEKIAKDLMDNYHKRTALEQARFTVSLIKEAGYGKLETFADLKARARKRPNLIIGDD